MPISADNIGWLIYLHNPNLWPCPRSVPTINNSQLSPSLSSQSIRTHSSLAWLVIFTTSGHAGRNVYGFYYRKCCLRLRDISRYVCIYSPQWNTSVLQSKSTSCARFFHITRETALLSFCVFNWFRLCLFVHVLVVYCNYSLPNCVYDSARLRAQRKCFRGGIFSIAPRRNWLKNGNFQRKFTVYTIVVQPYTRPGSSLGSAAEWDEPGDR